MNVRATVSTVVVVVVVAGAGVWAQLRDPTHETTTAAVPGMTPDASRCPISTDETYGLTPVNPVKTGRGDLYMAARQVRYLSALRGPAGEGTHFKRSGSTRAPDGTILDVYSMEVLGGAKTTLYVDGYHWADPLAPAGFLCGSEMNLARPGPDAAETAHQQRSIAVELGAADVEPISLDPDGTRTHGVVFDHMRLIGLAARASAAAGRALEADRLPPALIRPQMVVIAVPIACGTDIIPPETVSVVDARGGVAPGGEQAAGDGIAALAPGLTAPPGAVAVRYAVPNLIPGVQTRIRYARPCEGVQDVTLPAAFTPPRVLREAPAPAPPGLVPPADGARVVLQVFVAADGRARFPAFVSGAFEFTDAAVASLGEWRFEPSRLNGAPVYQPERVLVVVK